MASLTKINGRYHVRVRRAGFKAQCKTLTQRADALAWARETEIELERGTLRVPDAPLRSLIIRYSKDISPLKKSHASEAIRLRVLLQNPIADYPISQITPTVIAEYRDTRLNQVSPSTCLRDLVLLSHIFSVSMREWGYPFSSNPVTQIRKPKGSKARTRRLETDEEKALITALGQSDNPWAKPLVVVALETAMRRGELHSLKWEHVHLHQSYVHLPDTKNGSSRDAPLSQLARETLSQLPRDISGMVFPIHFEALKSLWQRICKKLELKDLRFHDLRHEATSRFFEKGLNVMEAAAITGHKDLKMLQRYTHLKASDLARKLG